jgi:hypothetical protein
MKYFGGGPHRSTNSQAEFLHEIKEADITIQFPKYFNPFQGRLLLFNMALSTQYEMGCVDIYGNFKLWFPT